MCLAAAGAAILTSACSSGGASGPQVEGSALPGKPARSAITLLAVGDVNLGRQCGDSLLSEGASYPFGHLRTWIDSFDVAFCNLESNISDQNGETVKPNNRLVFTAPPVAAQALKQSGWDIISTANNHAQDYGLAALKETIGHLSAVGLAFNGTALDASGLYQPTYLEVRGYRLAFLAVTDNSNAPYHGARLERHLNWADRAKLLPALRAAEQQADFTILSHHGGGEYASRPTAATRDFLHWCVDHGVDLVIGHHPHVIQGVEWRKKALILYSLGNFTFYQKSNPIWTDYGLAAVVTLRDDGIEKCEFIPIQAHFQARIITDPILRKKVMDRLAELSLPLAGTRTTN
jgi:poly-gamma-glutamate synthesis protein (capsule biosynthesis protein)